MRPTKALFAASLTLGATLALAGALAAAADPLPSWREAEAKRAIVAFVASATDPKSPGFVAPEERVAVFDNDGTLWAEQPMYFQLAFAIDRVKQLAARNPQWKDEEPFESLLAGDTKGALAGGQKAILEIVMASHAWMTTEEFARIVREWVATARHPRFDRPYTELVYQPMLELLAHLRDNGFATYIVSGGGIDFMRPWAERVYGIPPERVVGSSIATRYELRGGEPVLVREARIGFVDDGPGKPVGIHEHIGRRPVLAFGNSDGDLQMLEWTAAGSGARFVGLVHHTDAEREWAYDRDSQVGRLDEALAAAKPKGWTVVDMKSDWARVFPFDAQPDPTARR